MSEVDVLVRGLDGAVDGTEDRSRMVALLWSWLDRHLHDLGALTTKPHAIRAAVQGADRFDGWSSAERERVVNNPLRGAAELLARIELRLEEEHAPPFTEMTQDIDGEDVFVIWKQPALAERAGGGDGPPAAVEQPSLAVLARRLSVCPRVHRNIELMVKRPEGRGWTAACDQLELGLSQVPPTLAVHLDALGDRGLSGWIELSDPRVGWFDASQIDADDELGCGDEAVAAIEATQGGSSLLVMPELAATPTVLDRIRVTLHDRGDAPALTVVGLYHYEAEDANGVDPELVGDEPVSRRVNEAVVLGPDGEELWRHRKLSTALGPADRPGAEGEPAVRVAEDIAPGRTLSIVQCPIGAVAVVICLDSFIENVRDRIGSSGADVILVPSLSPRVHRHRDSLQQLVQRLWGIAFVCNRSFKPAEEGRTVWDEHENRSFWAIQRRQPEEPTRCPDRPGFVFRLGEDV